MDDTGLQYPLEEQTQTPTEMQRSTRSGIRIDHPLVPRSSCGLKTVGTGQGPSKAAPKDHRFTTRWSPNPTSRA